MYLESCSDVIGSAGIGPANPEWDIGTCCGPDGKGERLDIDPSGARCGCFLPDLTRLARHLPAPTSLGLYRGLELTLQFIAGAN